jgi:hypothetical protein
MNRARALRVVPCPDHMALRIECDQLNIAPLQILIAGKERVPNGSQPRSRVTGTTGCGSADLDYLLRPRKSCIASGVTGTSDLKSGEAA